MEILLPHERLKNCATLGTSPHPSSQYDHAMVRFLTSGNILIDLIPHTKFGTQSIPELMKQFTFRRHAEDDPTPWISSAPPLRHSNLLFDLQAIFLRRRVRRQVSQFPFIGDVPPFFHVFALAFPLRALGTSRRDGMKNVLVRRRRSTFRLLITDYKSQPRHLSPCEPKGREERDFQIGFFRPHVPLFTARSAALRARIVGGGRVLTPFTKPIYCS